MMLPIFKEYITFLQEKSDKVGFLKEGYYWYDNSIIKAFDFTGELKKIARINVTENLKLNIKLYDEQTMILENWNNTIKRFEKELCEIELESNDIIKKYIEKYDDREFVALSSGGKDSSVTTFLLKKHINEPKIIFNNTSLDCADTYLHIKKEKNLIMINPKEGFYQWRERTNFIPTRFARACCDIFKESAMVDYLNEHDKYLFFMGMRNQESLKRANYTDEWRNHKWKNREWDAILPIRKWSELQIWLYILKNDIEINPKYKKGYSRVGCAIACPYYSKSTWILDEYWYPKARVRWKRILIDDFRKNNKDLIMNCTEEEYLMNWNGGVVRETPTEEVILQFAKRNNLDIDIASKYFNHNCVICGKKIKNKDVVGMNMKFGGRNINEMSCKTHLKEKLKIDNLEWDNYITIFKSQNCELF